MIFHRFIRVVLCVLSGLFFSVANAAEVTELKLAHQWPSSHFAYKLLATPLIENIEELSEGEIKIRHFPAQQLAKPAGMLDAVKNRVADIGIVGVTYVAESMPLTSAAELPGQFSSTLVGYKALKKLVEEKLTELEYLPQGVRPLYVALTPPYQITLKDDVALTSADDLKGLKFRVAGNTGSLIARSLDVVPVQLSTSDVYLGLERGVVDGTLFMPSSIKSYKLFEVSKTITANASMGSVVFVAFINEEVWQGLSKSAQQALMQAGEKVGDATAAKMEAGNTGALKFLSENGMRVVTLAPEAVADLNTKLVDVENDWVEKVSAKNSHAKEVLDSFKANLTQ